MRILVIAYACEPAEGSEPGAGWAFAQMLTALGDVHVITRANNRPSIEAAPGTVRAAGHLSFSFVDLPSWARFWKRGRVGIQPYYLLWQRAALRVGSRLHRARPFDLVWHVTLANSWLGSVGGMIGPPFVWGPIGGGVDAPLRMAPALGLRGSVYEGVRWAIRRVFRSTNPLAHHAWRSARLILVQNPETRGWLPRRYRDKAIVFPNVALDPERWPARAAPTAERGDRLATAFFAGNLLPLKGLGLAIKALVELPSWRLVIAGRGPDERRLRRLAVTAGVADRVRFLGQIPRDEVRGLLAGSDVFLFPSLRDDAGWAVAEARMAGVPIVCLDIGGPPLIAGGGVPVTRPRPTAHALAGAVRAAAERTPAGIDVRIDARRNALLDIVKASGLVPDGIGAS